MIEIMSAPIITEKNFIAPSTQPANIGPRDVRGRPPPTSPGRPLKILFDRPGDVLIWRSRDVPGRLIRDVP